MEALFVVHPLSQVLQIETSVEYEYLELSDLWKS